MRVLYMYIDAMTVNPACLVDTRTVCTLESLSYMYQYSEMLHNIIVFNCSVKAMLLLIKCKYRILEKFKPPQKKPTENGDIHFDKSGESDGLIEGEEKTVLDMDMELDSKVLLEIILSTNIIELP